MRAAAGLLVVLALLAASGARAVVAPPAESTCLTYDAKYADAPLMLVLRVPSGRLPLQDRAQVCPVGVACPYVRKAYVTRGDVVLASAPRDGFRCVYVGSAGRLSAGFVPDAALVPAQTDAGPISPTFLTGRWSDGNDLIVFTPTTAGVKADGDGIWPGRHFAGPPGPNIGEFHGVVRMQGDRLSVEDGVCHVDARRRGPYLVFSDNLGCGGMNVRFRGLYVKGSRLK